MSDKTYTVYFEFGEEKKKMKMKVKALNETLAIIKVRESIKVLKVKPEDTLNSFLDDILNALKK